MAPAQKPAAPAKKPVAAVQSHSQLVWQIIKNNNAYLVRGLHGARFSAEPGNLYNKHSYKYSGLANEKVVDVEAGEEGGLEVTVSRPRNASKPAKFQHTYAIKKKNFRRAAVGVGKAVASFRPDLKKAALARASAINKSQRVAKAAQKS